MFLIIPFASLKAQTSYEKCCAHVRFTSLHYLPIKKLPILNNIQNGQLICR